MVKLQIHIREVMGSNLGLDICLIFPLPGKSRHINSIRPHVFSSKTFLPVHQSSNYSTYYGLDITAPDDVPQIAPPIITYMGH